MEIVNIIDALHSVSSFVVLGLGLSWISRHFDFFVELSLYYSLTFVTMILDNDFYNINFCGAFKTEDLVFLQLFCNNDK